MSESGTEREVEDLEPDCPECESGRLVYYRSMAGWLCSFVECSNRVFRESEIRSLVDDDLRADGGTDSTGSDRPSDCPECGGSGFVTGDTGAGEAECLDEDCPTVVFEVRDDGHRADGGTDSTDIDRPAEETVVEWDAPVGGNQSVRVDPYAATITVNGRVFEVTKLCSEDVPDWLYRRADTADQQPKAGDRDE